MSQPEWPDSRQRPSEIPGPIHTDVGGEIQSTVYVGDHPEKDIAMAQTVGVSDVWAKYGVAQGHPGYKLLQRVSHWPEKAVVEEQEAVGQRKVQPPQASSILHKGFDEILELFEWSRLQTESEP